jgi:hypothetical protein
LGLDPGFRSDRLVTNCPSHGATLRNMITNSLCDMLDILPVRILHKLYYMLFFNRALVFRFRDKWLFVPVAARGKVSAPIPSPRFFRIYILEVINLIY